MMNRCSCGNELVNGSQFEVDDKSVCHDCYKKKTEEGWEKNSQSSTDSDER